MSTPSHSSSSSSEEEQPQPEQERAAHVDAAPQGDTEQSIPEGPAKEEVETTSPSAAPPVENEEVNGGPLGCCLGMTVGILLSLIVAILSRLYADPLASALHENLSTLTRILMAIIAIAGVIIGGYLGWKIGKRVYRIYDLSPRQQQRLAELEKRYQEKEQYRQRRRTR